MLGELKTALAEKGIAFAATDDAAAHIAHASYSRKYGARNMRRYIQTHVEDQLAEQMIADYQRTISRVDLDVDGDALRIRCSS